MRRHLYYIYKWNQGRSEASREGFVAWLRTLVQWMEGMTGVVLPPEEVFQTTDSLLNGEKIEPTDEELLNEEDDIVTDTPEERAITEGGEMAGEKVTNEVKDAQTESPVRKTTDKTAS